MDKDISEAASKLSAMRKTKRGGFNDPKVQAKIKQIKAGNRDRKTMSSVSSTEEEDQDKG